MALSFQYFSQISRHVLKKVLFVISIFLTFSVSAQQKKIKILHSDLSYSNEERFPGATILDGNVKISHEGAILTCKRAFYYKERNFFKAIENVVINQGDTITQNSDYVDYDANIKLMKSWGNVILKDPKMTLTTDSLNFDRQKQYLYYDDNATIQDEKNTLESKNGNYYLESKKFSATTNVTITNPDNLIESNHLDYYTSTGHAYLYGSSTITDVKTENKIYTERGFYDTKTDVSHFIKNNKLFIDNRTIEGDSLYYDKLKGFASATNNIQVIDTAESFVARGNYAEYFQKLDSIFMVKRAVAISITEQDSMFIHGDTLLLTGKKDARIIRTYHNVKIFKSDLQGKCDSLHTNQALGITRMFENPVLWSGESQITGDSIQLLTNQETKKLDSLKILGNSFIIQKDSIDPDNFNQIKGRNMYGKFSQNKLKFLLVKGSGQSIYFNRNDQGVLETITKELAGEIEFELVDNQIESIKYVNQSDGKTYPPSKFPEIERKLKGFIWREDEQPKKKEDIFKKGLSEKDKKEKNPAKSNS